MVAALVGFRMAWLALPGPFLTLLAQMGIETSPLPLQGHHSGTVGSFQSGGAFTGRRALVIESLLINGCS